MKFIFVECDSFARFHRTYVMHIIGCHASWDVTAAAVAAAIATSASDSAHAFV